MTSNFAPEALLALSSAHVAARALHVVAELGTADLLDAEPRTAEQLSEAAGVVPDALDRLLRLLESHGLFSCNRSGGWSHTEASRLLRTDHPTSMRAFARMSGMPFSWGSFTALEGTVRTGEPGIATLDPGGAWSYLLGHPGELAIFDQAMTAKAHHDVSAVLAAYDFSPHSRIADIGGGRGHLIHAVLTATDAAHGVLFELPQVAAEVLPAARLDVVAGNFFTDPLPACDAYLLMNIVHDWDDKEAVAILTAVADSGRAAQATVLLIETVLPEGPEPHWAKTLDVMMLAITGGRERTLAGYQDLLDAAGMDLIQVRPMATHFAIVEARVR